MKVCVRGGEFDVNEESNVDAVDSGDDPHEEEAELGGARRGRCVAGGGRIGDDSAEAVDRDGDAGGDTSGPVLVEVCFP